MIGAVALVLAGLIAGQAGAAAPHDHGQVQSFLGSPEEEVGSLADNVDAAIKVCTGESARAASGKEVVPPPTERALKAGILQWVEQPPQSLVEQALGRPARFGRWFDPHAEIFLVAYRRYPACVIVIGRSPWAEQIRPALYAKIQDDAFWKMDAPEQPFQKAFRRATFHADVTGLRVRPIISIVAPEKAREDHVQLRITVGLTEREDK